MQGFLQAHVAALVSFSCLVISARSQPVGNSPLPASVALSNHLNQLNQIIPPGFTAVVQLPFVVIGDESPALVCQHAVQTVKTAVDCLKRDYFTNDPSEIIDIWLFKDAASYTNHARSLFHDTPTTPFGYYSAQHHALVMNIATGGGTLVHEIVHPFIRANFPDCPPWFNEGLASLYEASSFKDGHIFGLINWRYKGLEKSIKDGKLISFQKLTALAEDEFYGRRDNSNYSEHYAQARYLCFYLQEKDLLAKFYRQFVANSKADPTGYKTLQQVLGESDMSAFQKKWEKYILELRGH